MRGIWREELTKGFSGGDLHGDLRRRDDSVVGVGLMASVHAALESLAGGVEAGLRDRVVLGEELEDDHVTNGDILQLIGLVDQPSRASNSDGVGGRGGRGSSLATRRSSDGLGHGDLLIVGGLLSPRTRVGPDDDDFCLGIGSKATPQQFIELGLVPFLSLC